MTQPTKRIIPATGAASDKPSAVSRAANSPGAGNSATASITLPMPQHSPFQSPTSWKRSGWPSGVRAFAIAVLCAAHGASGAAAQPSSAAHSAPSAHTVDGYASFMAEAARRFAIPPFWIAAVIHVESGGDARVVSPRGAMGLMQIMPQTWLDLRSRYHLGIDPFDPRDNILGGTAYLRSLYDRFGASGFLAAYNAGPQHFKDYLAGVRPFSDETKHYLDVLARMLPDLPIIGASLATGNAGDWRSASLFVNARAAQVVVRITIADQQIARGSSDTPGVTGVALTPHSDGLFASVHQPVTP